VKRVYYLSAEFMIGRHLDTVLVNLELEEACRRALGTFGMSLSDVAELEWDAGLGAGGLGRLAACLLDSMATLGLPSYGYGIRYEYGIFSQKIEEGRQIEMADNWLRYGNPWEVPRPELIYPVRFYGLFDCQIKRIHEYKRQLLNVLHVIVRYNRLRDDPSKGLPRTVIFAGKAAPAYWMAKKIIHLIHAVAGVVNRDPKLEGRLKMVFIPNYGVSLAELIIPAADLSEQISTAGSEASGTSNMKLALNGALMIGTLDGANIEIQEAVGAENFFLFGLNAEQVEEKIRSGYQPLDCYHQNPELAHALDMIRDGFFSPEQPDVFQPIVDALLRPREPFMVLADFAAYAACQERVSTLYAELESWTRNTILNVARMGYFSSDRTVREYARDIWNVDV